MPSSAWLRRLVFIGLLSLAFLWQPSPHTEAHDLALELPEQRFCLSDLCLLKSDQHGLTLEVRLPRYTVSSKASADGALYDSIAVPGWDWLREEGRPQLPVRTVMIGLPLQAEVELQVLEVETHELEGTYDIPPVPESLVEWKLPAAPNKDAILPRYVGKRIAPDPATYLQDTFYPDSLARVVNDGFLRHQRVATIALTPFQYNPTSGRVRVAERFTVQVTFPRSEHPGETEAFSGVEPAGFEGLLERHLLNYGSSRHWRGTVIQDNRHQVWQPPEPGYKVLVSQDGLYQLTRDDLSAAGVPVGDIDPRTFQVFNRGQEVAINVQGEKDGGFDADDFILFYGLNPQTKYTDLNVYWLTWGSQQGRRMAERDGSLVGGDPTPVSFEAREHFEEGGFYFSNAIGDDDLERWLWNYVFAPAFPSQIYSFDLPVLPSGEYTASLEIALYGGIEDTVDPDHHTQIFVNGHLVEDAWWDGIDWRISQPDFPQSYLLQGANEIRVECPNDTGVGYDFVLIDWFNLSYWGDYTAQDDQLTFGQETAGAWEYHITDFSSPDVQVFDLTEPISVTQIVSLTLESGVLTYTLKFRDVVTEEKRYLALTPAHYLSPTSILPDTASNWQSPDHGADYIIISHSDFFTEAVSLADYRADQGLRTIVADVQDVFDEFSFGLPEPKAIRDFLAHAYENWVSPAPAYVLLIGDGLYDFKGYSGSGMQNYVIPYLAYVDPWLGETSADNRYVSVSGEDILADMHIGRLPVNTPSEAAAVVAKTMSYESNPPPGTWNQTVTFVADNPDQAGDFYALSDDLIDHYIPAPYITDTIYLGQTCPYENPSVECKQRIIEAINVTGTLLVNYIGHASIVRWAQESLFGVSDIPALTNSERFPVFLPMNCYDGYYIYPMPSIPCTGESVLRAENKGAVASWSAAGLGVATGHDFLDRGFLQAVFYDDVRELGPATLEGKLWVYNSGANHDLIETFHLFGDPALQIHTLKTDVEILKTVDPSGWLYPNEVITYTLAYSNAGPATAHHVVISDVLPTALIDPVVVSSGAAIAPRPGSRFVWDVADLAAGEGGIITVTAVVSPTFTGAFSNTASIATTALDTDINNNVTGPLLNYVAIPDLAIEKQGPAEASTSSTITYTLTYSNAGAATARHVIITDVLPAALISPTVVSAGAAITPRMGSRFVWDAADLDTGQGGVITITAVVNPAFGGLLTNAATIATADSEASQANNTATLTTQVPHRMYLPLIVRDYLSAPDLVVHKVIATSYAVTVTISNQGNASVINEFWVDVYIDPDPVPTAVNQSWPNLADEGLVWGVTSDALPLAPGEAITLTVGDAYFAPEHSLVSWPLPEGTPVYAQVDSANTETDYGAVLETHEIAGGAYNNITGTISTAGP